MIQQQTINSKKNISSVTVRNLVTILGRAYTNLIKGGKPLTMMPSVMLWGPPGVGKSAGVRQIAEKITEKTGKKAIVTDVRLLLFNPIDLRGIPTANEDKTLAVWLKPKIFQMDESEDVINILFLDEITAAPSSVQAAAYQIVLDRTIGEHKLPDNCFVIAAGNRVTDRSVANKMPKALANKMMHFEVTTDSYSWQYWAEKEGLNEALIDYLGRRKSALMRFDESSDDVAFPTPRTWKMVSDVIDICRGNVSFASEMICGLVGQKEGELFRDWYLNNKGANIEVEEIFTGKCRKIPETKPELAVLIGEMTVYAREHADDLNQIRNSLVYAKHLPIEYASLLVMNYRTIGTEIREVIRHVDLEAIEEW